MFESVVPSGAPQPRVSFVAERRGERGFILSATPAEVPFSAIPQGTHRLVAGADAVTAAGFAGPSGSGEEIAYLRWRIDGISYELAATPAAIADRRRRPIDRSSAHQQRQRGRPMIRRG